MADRTQELTLLLRAQIKGQGIVDDFKMGLDGVAEKAHTAAERLEGMGRATAVGLGMAAGTLLTGGSLGEAAAQLGVHIAEELTETFGEQAIAKLTSSSLMATLTAPLAAVGSTIGAAISAAIPIGMALLPVILIGAIVAAIAVLIFNEDIRNKVFDFIGGVIRNIQKALGDLPATLLDLVGKGVDFVAKNIGPFVGGLVKSIVDGLVSLPGKIVDVIASAFRNLKIDIGPFHIRSTGVTIDLPDINAPGGRSTTPGSSSDYIHGEGGWVGLHGPELGILGDKGPEYIIPNRDLGSLGGTTVVIQIAGQTVASVLLPLLSGELAAELQAAAPTALRT